MGIEKKVQNADIPEANANQSYGVMDRFREGIKGSKAYKGLVGVLSGLALGYAVNMTDFSDGRVMNTASAEQAEASVPSHRETNVSSYNQLGALLQKDKSALVMYTTSDPNMPDKYREEGNEVWEIFKQELGNQVNNYIKVDSKGWYDKAAEEIGEKTFPSIIFYPKETSLKGSTDDCVIIPGIPDNPYNAIKFVKENAGLK